MYRVGQPKHCILSYIYIYIYPNLNLGSLIYGISNNLDMCYAFLETRSPSERYTIAPSGMLIWKSSYQNPKEGHLFTRPASKLYMPEMGRTSPCNIACPCSRPCQFYQPQTILKLALSISPNPKQSRKDMLPPGLSLTVSHVMILSQVSRLLILLRSVNNLHIARNATCCYSSDRTELVPSHVPRRPSRQQCSSCHYPRSPEPPQVSTCLPIEQEHTGAHESQCGNTKVL